MLRKYLALLLGWLLLIGGSLLWNLQELEKNTLSNASAVARANLVKDISFRDWVASHGGVYVPISAHTPPNPYLKIPERDVVTTTGMKLTLMNPAFVIREVQDDFNGSKMDLSHLTSLKLLNPNNKPDAWEIKALQSFERGNNEMMELANMGGDSYLRLMKPIFFTEGCLNKCHAVEGYKVGDVRGGIGAYVKMRPFTDVQRARTHDLAFSHGLIWLIGALGLGLSYRRERMVVAEQQASQEKIYALAYHDDLTHLPNRHLLMDRLQMASAVCARMNKSGAVLFIDLDHFKRINEIQGYEVGDELLIEVARRLTETARVADTVARLGADEFVVVLKTLDASLTQANKQARLVAEKLQQALSQPYSLKQHLHSLTPSIGIEIFNGVQDIPTNLVKHAEVAMHEAKRSGRNFICTHDSDMQAALEARDELQNELRIACATQQFQLYYQIQVDGERRAIGAEALVRWIHPLRGMVSPAQFIPLAEETTLILDIGGWVLHSACQQLRDWLKHEQTRHLTLAVNVSAKQFNQTDFVSMLTDIVHGYHLDASRLKLELTESVLLSDVTDVINKMYALKALGVRLSMDDFGTGYSSLSYLKQLPLDQLKIDQSFVRDMTFDQNDQVMVQAIIDMAKNFHLNVIAEGVETEAQQSLLQHMGCLAYQGYLFGKPMPIEQFEALLKPV